MLSRLSLHRLRRSSGTKKSREERKGSVVDSPDQARENDNAGSQSEAVGITPPVPSLPPTDTPVSLGSLIETVVTAPTFDVFFPALVAAAQTTLLAVETCPPSANAPSTDPARFNFRQCDVLLAAAETAASGSANWEASRAALVAMLEAARFGPVSTRALTTVEQVIVLESSRLHGHRFPPVHLAGPNTSKLVISDISLSAGQQRACEGFLRARDALGLSDGDGDGMRAVLPALIVQDLVPDCSLVAGLIVLADWRERCLGSGGRHTDLLARPFSSHHDGVGPTASDSGVYRIRLCFNGIDRLVPITDVLPTGKAGRLLFVRDLANPTVIWPALLEKAYLTVRGGYRRFAGSCPAADLAALTGWLPEQVHLRPDHGRISPDVLWNRLLSCWTDGDVVITAGTGGGDSQAELERRHSYAVVGLDSAEGVPRLLIRNPLGTRTGAVIQPDPGRWLDLSAAVVLFDSLYLNWNPALFDRRLDLHFRWHPASLSPAARAETHLLDNPQFSIQSGGGGSWAGIEAIWILLTRHFSDAGPDGGTAGDAKEEIEPAGDDRDASQAPDLSAGFVALLAFSAKSRLLDRSSAALVGQTPYVDAPFCLLRLDRDALERTGPSLAVVASQQGLIGPTHRFSLSVLASGPKASTLTVAPAKSGYSYSGFLEASWPASSAGELFLLRQTVGPAEDGGDGPPVVIFLEALANPGQESEIDGNGAQENNEEETFVNLKMFKPAGPVVSSVVAPTATGRLLADSGNYAPRVCRLDGPWEMFASATRGSHAGSLSKTGQASEAVQISALVQASTYTPRAGRFCLRWFSHQPVQLTRLRSAVSFSGPVLGSKACFTLSSNPLPERMKVAMMPVLLCQYARLSIRVDLPSESRERVRVWLVRVEDEKQIPVSRLLRLILDGERRGSDDNSVNRLGPRIDILATATLDESRNGGAQVWLDEIDVWPDFGQICVLLSGAVGGTVLVGHVGETGERASARFADWKG